MSKLDCPNDECEGEVEFEEYECEQGPYADESYHTWTVMVIKDIDGTEPKCSEGCVLTAEQIKQLEADATEDYRNGGEDW